MKICNNKYLAFFFVWVIICVIPFPASSQQLKVPLDTGKISDPPGGGFIGISNLFFNKIDSSINFSFPKAWKDIEADQLIMNASFEPVYIFRTKDKNGDYEYYADLNNDKKITENEQLTLKTFQSDKKIADFQIRAKNLSTDKFTRSIHYQLIIIGKYIYARINEQRTGILSLDGKTYQVLVRPFYRSSVNYSKEEAKIFIDFDRNGIIQERWGMEAGHAVPGEEIPYGDPFKIGNKSFIVDSVEESGRWLTIKPYSSSEALAVGFKFPSLKLYDINGELLPKTDKKYLPIELWSVSCPFCESVRTKLNTLIGEKDAPLVDWFAISREDKPTVKSFLSTHPFNAKIVIPEGTDWRYLNPLTSTPLFYLIANDGTIIFKGAGANMVNIIETLIKPGV